MCQYRYHYFATCRHQQTVLFDFCDKAISIPPAHAPKPAPASEAQGPTGKKKGAKGETAGKKLNARKREAKCNEKPQQQQGAGKKKARRLPDEHHAASSSEPLPSGRPSASPPHQQQSSAGSIGSASITEEPVVCPSASISQQIPTYKAPVQQTPIHQNSIATDDMAGSRPFGSAWSHGGSTGKTGRDASGQEASYVHLQHEDDAALLPAFPVRRQRSGIREYTEESCILRSSLDVDPSRGVQCQHIGADLRRATSYASTNTGDSGDAALMAPCVFDSYEAIEADINMLKKEVGKLKEDTYSREDREPYSAAAWLQKAHDEQKVAVHNAPPERLKSRTPPSSNEFPALGSGKSTIRDSARPTDGSQWPDQHEARPSYASAATSGMKDAIDKAFSTSTSRARRTDSKVLDVLSTSSLNSRDSSIRHGVSFSTLQNSSRAGHRHVHDYEDANGSVIVSPGRAEAFCGSTDNIVVSNSTPSTPNGKSFRDTPHFAQPTAAFTRRAGETLRRDSIAGTLKAGDPDASPSRHSNKRKSLPGDWLSGKSPKSASVRADPTSSPLTFSSPVKDGEWQMVDDVTTKAATPTARNIDGPQHVLRKKTSSYMSPTAATTHRTIATLGAEPIKRKTGTLRVNTIQANHYSSLSSPESLTMSSASSLANSVLERSSFSSTVSPPSPQRLTQRAFDSIQATDSMRYSPRKARQLGVDKKSAQSPKSPSKIPRAHWSLNAQLQQTSPNTASATAHAACSNPLDAVANTVTRRRTSHADILKPILDKLDSQGLRRSNPDPANVAGHQMADEVRIISRQDTRRQLHVSLEETPRNPSPALADLALLVRQGLGGKKAVTPPHRPSPQQIIVASMTPVDERRVPPHLRASRQCSTASTAKIDASVPPHLRASRQCSTASTGTDISRVDIYTSTPSAPCPTPTVEADTSNPVRDPAAGDASLQEQETPAHSQSYPKAVATKKDFVASALAASFYTDQATAQLQPGSKLAPVRPQATSLRATAASFTPIWQPQNIVQQLSLLSWDGTLDSPDETLSTLPSEVKNSIELLREYKNTGGRVLPGTMPCRTPSPSKRQDQRFWGALMAEAAPTFAASAGLPGFDRDGDVTMVDAGTEQVARNSVGTASQYGVQVGQVLKPALSPGKKSVQWTLQDTDGQEKPVTFGRAAPPAFAFQPTDATNIHTPIISPSSDDTTPIKTPLSVHAWTIGSGGFAPANYGWKGGDGKEISFSGNGPHAERDPNSPINMHFYSERVKGCGAAPSAAPVGSTGENMFSSPKVWPRSMKQWAELAGYNKVPCGSMEIMDAVEQMPGSLRATGLCNDCSGGH